MNFSEAYRGMADIEWRDGSLEEFKRIRALVQEPCPDCGGIGAYDGAVCECQQVMDWIGVLLKSGIPKSYWGLTLEELQVPDGVKGFLRKYIDKLDNAIEKQQGLFFMGPNGTGKTAMMAEVGKAALLAGKRVIYTTLFSYMDVRFDEDDPLHDELEMAHVILLDEIDKGYGKEGNDYLQKTLQDFLRTALRQGKTMIMASNMNSDELKQSLDASILSLLYRNNQPLPVPGEDFGMGRSSRDFLANLSEEYDYHHPNILSCALRYNAPGLMREEKHGRN